MRTAGLTISVPQQRKGQVHIEYFGKAVFVSLAGVDVLVVEEASHTHGKEPSQERLLRRTRINETNGFA